MLLLPFLQLLAFLIFKLRRRAKPTAELKLCGRPAVAIALMLDMTYHCLIIFLWGSGPWQIWVDHVLTAYPLLSLLLGICLPLSFSLAGLEGSKSADLCQACNAPTSMSR